MLTDSSYFLEEEEITVSIHGLSLVNNIKMVCIGTKKEC